MKRKAPSLFGTANSPGGINRRNSVEVASEISSTFQIFVPICFTRNGEILGYDGGKALLKLNHRGELPEHCENGQQEGIYRILHCGMMNSNLQVLFIFITFDHETRNFHSYSELNLYT
ncbi:hypothetical protein CR513_11194, partial [Mucuna pruriens]